LAACLARNVFDALL